MAHKLPRLSGGLSDKNLELRLKTGDPTMAKQKIAVLAFTVFLFCAAQANADPTPVVLTFEGVGNFAPINDFYNGGAGGNLGISFVGNSIALVAFPIGNGAFSNAPSGITAAGFLSGSGDFMNVPAGFSTGFSFFYAALAQGQVTVWSGQNGTGNLLATLNLPIVPGCPGTPTPLCVWTPVGTTFNGTAESVSFNGATDNLLFDNMTLGSATAGGGGPTPTPEPVTMALLGAGSLALLGARRRKVA